MRVLLGGASRFRSLSGPEAAFTASCHAREQRRRMTRQIHFNAFEMNCVAHQSPGLWAHPRDRSWQYKDLEYWTDLAKILEKGIFDGIFIADVVGYYDV